MAAKSRKSKQVILLFFCPESGRKGGEQLKRYSVETVTEAAVRYFYIQDCETMEMELLPSRYLVQKVKSNRSPNTVKRAAFALCYYLEYLSEKQMEFSQVCQLAYDEQHEHFVRFLYWIKTGRHKTENDIKNPRNGTCNAYLKDVFRFYLFMEAEDPQFGSLRVLSYGQITVANAVGVKRVMRAKSFNGYLKAEERNVRAAEQNEIVTILKACTNNRDRLLLLLIAETGFRIGEILGVSYTRDIDYQNHTIRVWFRDDNENNARAKNAEYRRSRVSDDTFDFLLHYLAEYRKLLQRQDFLFINIAGQTAGQPLKAGSVYDMLGRMEKKTRIQITPHMLRRYFSVIRWKDGWPLEMISQALGHKHLDTTVKYLGLLDDRIMEASKAFYEKHSDDYGIRELL